MVAAAYKFVTSALRHWVDLALSGRMWLGYASSRCLPSAATSIRLEIYVQLRKAMCLYRRDMCSEISPPATACAGSPSKAGKARALSERTGRRGIHSPSLALCALTFLDASNNLLQASLYDYSADDHLAQDSMECFEAEDEIKLADVFEQPIESLDKDLYEVQKRQRRLGRCRDQDEVERSIVPVSDLRRRIRRRRSTSGSEQRW